MQNLNTLLKVMDSNVHSETDKNNAIPLYVIESIALDRVYLIHTKFLRNVHNSLARVTVYVITNAFDIDDLRFMIKTHMTYKHRAVYMIHNEYYDSDQKIQELIDMQKELVAHEDSYAYSGHILMMHPRRDAVNLVDLDYSHVVSFGSYDELPDQGIRDLSTKLYRNDFMAIRWQTFYDKTTLIDRQLQLLHQSYAMTVSQHAPVNTPVTNNFIFSLSTSPRASKYKNKNEIKMGLKVQQNHALSLNQEQVLSQSVSVSQDESMDQSMSISQSQSLNQEQEVSASSYGWRLPNIFMFKLAPESFAQDFHQLCKAHVAADQYKLFKKKSGLYKDDVSNIYEQAAGDITKCYEIASHVFRVGYRLKEAVPCFTHYGYSVDYVVPEILNQVFRSLDSTYHGIYWDRNNVEYSDISRCSVLTSMEYASNKLVNCDYNSIHVATSDVMGSSCTSASYFSDYTSPYLDSLALLDHVSRPPRYLSLPYYLLEHAKNLTKNNCYLSKFISHDYDPGSYNDLLGYSADDSENIHKTLTHLYVTHGDKALDYFFITLDRAIKHNLMPTFYRLYFENSNTIYNLSREFDNSPFYFSCIEQLIAHTETSDHLKFNSYQHQYAHSMILEKEFFNKNLKINEIYQNLCDQYESEVQKFFVFHKISEHHIINALCVLDGCRIAYTKTSNNYDDILDIVATSFAKGTLDEQLFEITNSPKSMIQYDALFALHECDYQIISREMNIDKRHFTSRSYRVSKDDLKLCLMDHADDKELIRQSMFRYLGGIKSRHKIDDYRKLQNNNEHSLAWYVLYNTEESFDASVAFEIVGQSSSYTIHQLHAMNQIYNHFYGALLEWKDCHYLAMLCARGTLATNLNVDRIVGVHRRHYLYFNDYMKARVASNGALHSCESLMNMSSKALPLLALISDHANAVDLSKLNSLFNNLPVSYQLSIVHQIRGISPKSSYRPVSASIMMEYLKGELSSDIYSLIEDGNLIIEETDENLRMDEKTCLLSILQDNNFEIFDRMHPVFYESFEMKNTLIFISEYIHDIHSGVVEYTNGGWLNSWVSWMSQGSTQSFNFQQYTLASTLVSSLIHIYLNDHFQDLPQAKDYIPQLEKIIMQSSEVLTLTQLLEYPATLDHMVASLCKLLGILSKSTHIEDEQISLILQDVSDMVDMQLDVTSLFSVINADQDRYQLDRLVDVLPGIKKHPQILEVTKLECLRIVFDFILFKQTFDYDCERVVMLATVIGDPQQLTQILNEAIALQNDDMIEWCTVFSAVERHEVKSLFLSNEVDVVRDRQILLYYDHHRQDDLLSSYRLSGTGLLSFTEAEKHRIGCISGGDVSSAQQLLIEQIVAERGAQPEYIDNIVRAMEIVGDRHSCHVLMKFLMNHQQMDCLQDFLLMIDKSKISRIINIIQHIDTDQVLQVSNSLQSLDERYLDKLNHFVSHRQISPQDLNVILHSDCLMSAIDRFRSDLRRNHPERYTFDLEIVIEKINEITYKKCYQQPQLLHIQRVALLKDFTAIMDMFEVNPVMIVSGQPYCIRDLDDEHFPVLMRSIRHLLSQESLTRERSHEIELVLVALVCETLYLENGMFPREVQILSLLNSMNHDGNVMHEIRTGDGKSIVSAMHAVWLWSHGKTVDIPTSNETLAQDHIQSFSAFYDFLSVPLLPHVLTADSSRLDYVDYGVKLTTVPGCILFKKKMALQGESLPRNACCVCDEIDAMLTTVVDSRLSVVMNKIYLDTDKWEHIYGFILDFVDDEELFSKNLCDPRDDVHNLRVYIDLQIDAVCLEDSKVKRSEWTQWIGKISDDELSMHIESAQIAMELEEGVDFEITRQSKVVPDVALASQGVITELDEHGLNVPLGVKEDSLEVQQRRMSMKNSKQDKYFSYAAPILDVTKRPNSSISYSEGVQPLLHTRLNRENKTLLFEIEPVSEAIISVSAKDYFDDYNLQGGRIIGLTGTTGSEVEVSEFFTSNKFVSFSHPSHSEDRVMDLGVVMVGTERERFDKLIQFVGGSTLLVAYRTKPTEMREGEISVFLSQDSIHCATVASDGIRCFPLLGLEDADRDDVYDVLNDPELNRDLSANSQRVIFSILSHLGFRQHNDAMSPVLLFMDSPKDAQSLYQHMRKKYLNDLQVYCGEEVESEEERLVLSQAGKANMITISTQAMGRGTDIITKHSQGMTIVDSCVTGSESDMRQRRGRGGRNGQVGRYIKILSAQQLDLRQDENPVAKYKKLQDDVTLTRMRERALLRPLHEIKSFMIDRYYLGLKNTSDQMMVHMCGTQTQWISEKEFFAKISSFNQQISDSWKNCTTDGTVDENEKKKFYHSVVKDWNKLLHQWVDSASVPQEGLSSPIVPLEIVSTLGRSLDHIKMKDLQVVSKVLSQIWSTIGSVNAPHVLETSVSALELIKYISDEDSKSIFERLRSLVFGSQECMMQFMHRSANVIHQALSAIQNALDGLPASIPVLSQIKKLMNHYGYSIQYHYEYIRGDKFSDQSLNLYLDHIPSVILYEKAVGEIENDVMHLELLNGMINYQVCGMTSVGVIEPDVWSHDVFTEICTQIQSKKLSKENIKKLLDVTSSRAQTHHVCASYRANGTTTCINMNDVRDPQSYGCVTSIYDQEHSVTMFLKNAKCAVYITSKDQIKTIHSNELMVYREDEKLFYVIKGALPVELTSKLLSQKSWDEIENISPQGIKTALAYFPPLGASLRMKPCHRNPIDLMQGHNLSEAQLDRIMYQVDKNSLSDEDKALLIDMAKERGYIKILPDRLKAVLRDSTHALKLTSDDAKAFADHLGSLDLLSQSISRYMQDMLKVLRIESWGDVRFPVVDDCVNQKEVKEIKSWMNMASVASSAAAAFSNPVSFVAGSLSKASTRLSGVVPSSMATGLEYTAGAANVVASPYQMLFTWVVLPVMKQVCGASVSMFGDETVKKIFKMLGMMGDLPNRVAISIQKLIVLIDNKYAKVEDVLCIINELFASDCGVEMYALILESVGYKDQAKLVDFMPELTSLMEPYQDRLLKDLLTPDSIITLLGLLGSNEKMAGISDLPIVQSVMKAISSLKEVDAAAWSELGMNDLIWVLKLMSHPEFSHFIQTLPHDFKFSHLVHILKRKNLLTEPGSHRLGNADVAYRSNLTDSASLSALDDLYQYQNKTSTVTYSAYQLAQRLKDQFTLSEDQLNCYLRELHSVPKAQDVASLAPVSKRHVSHATFMPLVIEVSDQIYQKPDVTEMLSIHNNLFVRDMSYYVSNEVYVDVRSEAVDVLLAHLRDSSISRESKKITMEVFSKRATSLYDLYGSVQSNHVDALKSFASGILDEYEKGWFISEDRYQLVRDMRVNIARSQDNVELLNVIAMCHRRLLNDDIAVDNSWWRRAIGYFRNRKGSRLLKNMELLANAVISVSQLDGLGESVNSGAKQLVVQNSNAIVERMTPSTLSDTLRYFHLKELSKLLNTSDNAPLTKQRMKDISENNMAFTSSIRHRLAPLMDFSLIDVKMDKK